MAASFVLMKNGVVTKVVHSAKKITEPHGDPAGDAGVIGRFSTKVRTSGPISEPTGRNH